ncbi:MAG: bifunctional [glutamine synthetase] adenylyltransferase/[glutamine synthetase]-adenylyl-L-tyrosine phosphorylase [Bifidobacteriaceae bacterium]|jgi:glutamate-ammonia-ligase adenylyltransferase|nr:bifunctional [glutamine synthetase] adenylyltransferase/[glutamine synthetase]-adenylyl-L-tyrosine phosphorylase [Bifidobacteriaceae bacterium]
MTVSLPPDPQTGGRFVSQEAAYARAGFADGARAGRVAQELAAEGFDLDPAAFAQVADPDGALLALARIAARPEAQEHLVAIIRDQRAQARLLAVLGGSIALGDHLVRHPEHLAVFLEPDVLPDAAPAPEDAGAPPVDEWPGEDMQVVPTAAQWAARAALLQAVGADPAAEVPVAATPDLEPLRVEYRRQLLALAAQDLASPTPTELFPQVGAALADMATGVLEAALAIARRQTPGHERARLAVIAMGKCGGRELNYISDVDVIYVAEPAGPDVPEQEALAVATELASALQRACIAPAKEPAIWQVDPNLRPEGKNGPLVRTLASHKAYYEKWAQTWEFQALLKARPAAGDAALGRAYYEMTRPWVWAAVGSENFVEDAQAMRRRVEEHVPPAEAERQIKLGRGGLRDVEFTVQLLQLVHGRSDPSIRAATTLKALATLAAGGYVGRAPAARLAACYRLLRTLEHRVQLHRLKRTHLMPTAPGELRQLARAARVAPPEAEQLEAQWKATRREVRGLHEELFYRPLLPETARLSAGEAQLAPEAARARLTALGYRNPEGALQHIAALTRGSTRQAAIQRQLLPVMLGWFAKGADPDAGLLSFRQLSESLGATPWFLRLLRDSAGAARALSHALSASGLVAQGLARSPESVAWFDADADLVPREAPELNQELSAILDRSAGDTKAGALAVRALRRRELTRVAAAMALHRLDDGAARFAVSEITTVALEGALRVAWEQVLAEGAEPLTSLAVVAMGSFGGHEMAVGSDADVLFVHRGGDGEHEAAAQAQAVAVAAATMQLLSNIGPEPPLEIDADLRPEGRNGPIVRSLAAYQEYYERWALGWERQALLRARPVAGDQALAARFMALAEPVRYRPEGLSAKELVELRRLKTRVERERLPRGVEPFRHVKLGPGGLLDVQWVAQLYQLRHAGQYRSLRVTGTIEALEACVEEGLMAADDAALLIEAWLQGMSIRNGNALWTGKANSPNNNLVPSERRALAGLAALMGYPAGTASQLPEDRHRTARRARAVFDRLFFD